MGFGGFLYIDYRRLPTRLENFDIPSSTLRFIDPKTEEIRKIIPETDVHLYLGLPKVGKEMKMIEKVIDGGGGGYRKFVKE